ncbi:hypothetical protein ASPFODRAFT_272280 [Aspergillus luchuensis CBS 106.47]|uniref:Uncharacterized protein n=1 Tax=Aspergillus luchuensis (strain CBS 106.47) TaxID=1137211 RepID=A0A1M3U0X7_ASPLC|nr:hypothetical protein ASPFODRAFT_272280 [Aspergillus luchuensis CBS 106.47]
MSLVSDDLYLITWSLPCLRETGDYLPTHFPCTVLFFCFWKMIFSFSSFGFSYLTSHRRSNSTHGIHSAPHTPPYPHPSFSSRYL